LKDWFDLDQDELEFILNIWIGREPALISRISATRIDPAPDEESPTVNETAEEFLKYVNSLIKESGDRNGT